MTTLVSLLIFYIIGFIAGYLARKDTIPDIYNKTKQKIDNYTSPVGVVKRPTQLDILKKTDPHIKKIEEGKEAMRRTLENIQELQ